MAERGPALLIPELNLFEFLNSLVKNRSDAGRAFGPGDPPKLFRRYSREWNSGAFQSSNGISNGYLASG